MFSKVLYIDLSKGDSELVDRADLFEKYIGGTGVATLLLEEECPKNVDPLSEEAPIILSIGPLSALFPCCTKVVAMFKSPLTNELGESHAGGRLALAMRFAGYDSIVIKGRADDPVYLSIHDDEVKMKDATSLWGISSALAVGRILREVEPGAGRRSIIRIGVAGERLIKYANVNVDTYRHFGRLGLGAVFGSKNLKAMVISGSKDVSVRNMDAYKEVYQKIYDEVAHTEAMKKYHDLGTSVNVNVLNQIKGLPTKNFKSSYFENAENISGENFADKYLLRKLACPHCPIGCIHVAMLKTTFAPGHDYEVHYISYDYELIYALGSNLGITSPEGVLSLIDRCEKHGLNAISTGVVLAWATEAYENDLITPQETLGIGLRWNGVEGYLSVVDNMVKMPNEFYKVLAQGVEKAAERYGGKEFAMALAGNEVAGYHTGPANIVGQIVGIRHSHLDNAGYSIDQKASTKQLSEEEMVDLLVKEDDWRCLCNSLICCLFARSIYDERMVKDALGSLGIEKTIDDLKGIGRDIFRAKYRFKHREGFKIEDVHIPKRFFETTSQLGKISEAQVQKMLQSYIQKRGS